MRYLTVLVFCAFLGGLSLPSYGGDRKPEETFEEMFPCVSRLAPQSHSASRSPSPSPSEDTSTSQALASSFVSESSESREEDKAYELVRSLANAFKGAASLLEQDQIIDHAFNHLGAALLFPGEKLKEMHLKNMAQYKESAWAVFNRFGLSDVKKTTFDKLWKQWTQVPYEDF